MKPNYPSEGIEDIEAYTEKSHLRGSNGSGLSAKPTGLSSDGNLYGVGQSIHETGVDLIALNEIRELPKMEQLIFYQSAKPMRCQKVRYFEYVDFRGKFDENPLEQKS